ncbi:MAG: RnfABCDGE type electron transport complex subunit D [Lachnospiraceae bacterium]|nr:RnfABCDGE type electron transport complex subunit D [Lachnospiraceae bacterium]
MSETINPVRRVSSNPHIRSKISTDKIMLCVIIALLPATCYGVKNFGVHALLQIIFTVAAAVAAEAVYELIMKKKVTVLDFSAAVTGLLLALNMPPAAPLWVGPMGSVFAIIVVKMLFGGLGQNFMNPALAARCFLIISFPSIMTNFSCDAYTGATPLARLKAGETVDVYDMIVGNIPGTIGETSMIAIIIGAAFLLMIGVIDLKVPGSYIITFIIFYGIFGGHGFDGYYISAQLAGGGLMLGAFFMATDYVTRPVTKTGQIVFGIILGLLTGIFRVFGASSEGVSYAIIIGNLLTPLITKYTAPKAFGKGGERV